MSLYEKYSRLYPEQVEAFDKFYNDMLISFDYKRNDPRRLYDNIEKHEKIMQCEDISDIFSEWYQRRVTECFSEDQVVIHNILVRSKSHMLDLEEQQLVFKTYFGLYLMGNVMLTDGIVAIYQENGIDLNEKLLPLFPVSMHRSMEQFARAYQSLSMESYMDYIYTSGLNRMNLILAMMPLLFFQYLLNGPVDYKADRMHLCHKAWKK